MSQEIDAAKRKAEDKCKSALLGAKSCCPRTEEGSMSPRGYSERRIQQSCDACGATIPADGREANYGRFFCCQAVTARIDGALPCEAGSINTQGARTLSGGLGGFANSYRE